MTAKNCSLAIVGKGMPFTILEDEKLEPYVALLRAEENTAPAAGPAAPGDGPQDMET